MKTNELREKYLAFFETKGHARRPSDVLVPTWDPSVLFTPAGMNQFKDHFLGKVKLEFTRATTCQKCLRTGDIDNVGRTAYHHTFFEMLGNFSFGDYFKREAIGWAWEFLTDKKWLGIDPKRLTVTVYTDDDEAADIWRDEIKLPVERIERCGEDENFWPASAPSQGPDGVCGPCSEIYYHPDQGKAVEIWNLVFTQFNRVGDPPNNLRPLPSKNIDTGMGLERTAATLQGVDTNFHIDILKPIVLAAAEVCGVKYDPASDNGRRLRRITDHVRACTMAVHENVYPGAQKEKYVIRRLLRRAVLDGHQMGRSEPFLFQLVPAVVEMMKTPYPELTETVQRVQDVIKKEEANFFGTIDAGLARIEKIFADMKSQGRMTIDGGEAAELYTTFGVPAELLETMAAENNLAFDWPGFRKAMEQHGELSGKAVHTVMGGSGPMDAIKKVLHECVFLGYDATEATAEVKFIVAQDKLCDHVKEVGHQNEIVVVLDRTPFYGESGGQVGDTGEIVGEKFRFRVADTQKDGQIFKHIGHLVEGELHTGMKVTAKVDAARRGGIRRAHSATHLLHHALQKTLGTHAQQQGSKVEDDYLRFDFTNMSPVSAEQLESIAKIVDERVAAAVPVKAEILPLAEARKQGAMMLFGEKYPDPVRMVAMGDFSRELCGGIHLSNTKEVGAFEIFAEEAVAAGTRRIVALTGEKAKQHVGNTKQALADAAKALGVAEEDVPAAAAALAVAVRELKKHGSAAGAAAKPTKTGSAATLSYAQQKQTLREAARALNVGPFDVPKRIAALLAERESLAAQAAQRAAAGPVSADALLEKAETIKHAAGETTVVVAEAAVGGANELRTLIDQIRKKTKSSAVLLAAKTGEDAVTLVAGLSRDLVDAGQNAGNWVREVAKIVGGSGGGKPDLAQAGGKQPGKIGEALERARANLKAGLGAAG
ncbi:MAG: alanine--tRNA ligase [Planctomycetota bacterium]|nr:MAG: alanine--tRNA ligase [Planctomycetota bacterium]